MIPEPVALMTRETPIGVLELAATEAGLSEVRFAEGLLKQKSPQDQRRAGASVRLRQMESDATALLRQALKELDEYFSGTRLRFDLPLDLRGTTFQLQVWHVLQTIPYGTTISYRSLAEAAGRPAAIRAAGAANGANPLAIIVPCHRVVGADGSLTGYEGGLETKRFLLELERRFTGSPVL